MIIDRRCEGPKRLDLLAGADLATDLIHSTLECRSAEVEPLALQRVSSNGLQMRGLKQLDLVLAEQSGHVFLASGQDRQ